MNREELEKMFDKKFCNIVDGIELNLKLNENIDEYSLKQFIFNEIIPEVLNSIIIDNEGKLINIDAIVNIKQKAKELYNITL